MVTIGNKMVYCVAGILFLLRSRFLSSHGWIPFSLTMGSAADFSHAGHLLWSVSHAGTRRDPPTPPSILGPPRLQTGRWFWDLPCPMRGHQNWGNQFCVKMRKPVHPRNGSRLMVNLPPFNCSKQVLSIRGGSFAYRPTSANSAIIELSKNRKLGKHKKLTLKWLLHSFSSVYFRWWFMKRVPKHIGIDELGKFSWTPLNQIHFSFKSA